MNEKYRLDVDHWKDMTIWNDYEIPYLFLGYNPKPHDSRPLDDYISLNDKEYKKYSDYLDLIRDAIKRGKLTPVEINLRGFCSLRAAEIKVWRKDKDSIKPVKIYIDMEDAVSESLSNDIKDPGISQSRGTINTEKEYNPRNIIYVKALRKLMELDDLDYGWKRIIEKTPGIQFNDEETEVIGIDGFGEPVSVKVKSFRNAVSKMRGNLKNKKEQ